MNVVLISFSRFAGQQARAGRGPLGNIMPGNAGDDPSRYGSWTALQAGPRVPRSTVTSASDTPTGESAVPYDSLSGG